MAERPPSYVAEEEEPREAPPEAPPRPERRLVNRIVAAVVTAGVLWGLLAWAGLGELGPVVAGITIPAILGAVVRDRRQRVWLAVVGAAGVLGTSVMLGAPIFGIILAALVIASAVAAATDLGRRVGARTASARKGYRSRLDGFIGTGTRRRTVLTGFAVVVLALAVILPFLDDWFAVPTWVAQATSGGTLSRVALFILFTLGLNVVVGFAGLLDLGYVAFWAIGSYTAAILTGAARYTMDLRADLVTSKDAPVWEPWMWLILFAALGTAVVAGLLLGSPTLRLRGDYLAIVTLGFGEIVRITANNLDNITVGPRGISDIPHPAITVGPVNIQWGTLIDVKYYYLLLVFVVLWVMAITLLDRSRIGRAWVAVREDEVAAAAMGVPVVRMKLAAFAIGACTAGVGGVIYAEQVNFINPQTFDILNSIFILCMVVIGGMGSIVGSIVGASAFIVLPEIFREFEDYRFFVFGAALVIVMIFRPQGLVPSKRRKAELKGGVHEEQLFEAQMGEGPEVE